MAIIYRTDGDWGTGKGSPLTAGEVDSNFWQLVGRVVNLEENGVQPKQIHSIQVINNQMTIMLDDLTTTFGPYALPVAAFKWTEFYEPGREYKPYDIFRTQDAIYYVNVEHTAASEFNEDEFNSEGEFYVKIFQLQPPPKISIGFFYPGRPGYGVEPGRSIFGYLCDREFYLPAGLPDSQAFLRSVASDDILVFPIMKNHDEIGTVEFITGTNFGEFFFEDTVQFGPGDILRIHKPEFDNLTESPDELTADSNAKELYITLTGIQGTP